MRIFFILFYVYVSEMVAYSSMSGAYIASIGGIFERGASTKSATSLYSHRCTVLTVVSSHATALQNAVFHDLLTHSSKTSRLPLLETTKIFCVQNSFCVRNSAILEEIMAIEMNNSIISPVVCVLSIRYLIQCTLTFIAHDLLGKKKKMSTSCYR